MCPRARGETHKVDVPSLCCCMWMAWACLVGAVGLVWTLSAFVQCTLFDSFPVKNECEARVLKETVQSPLSAPATNCMVVSLSQCQHKSAKRTCQLWCQQKQSSSAQLSAAQRSARVGVCWVIFIRHTHSDMGGCASTWSGRKGSAVVDMAVFLCAKRQNTRSSNSSSKKGSSNNNSSVTKGSYSVLSGYTVRVRACGVFYRVGVN